jgi:hypothetical protein
LPRPRQFLFHGCTRGDAEGVVLDGDELVENFVDLLGEQGRLLLLQDDAYDLRPCADLQVERARPRKFTVRKR